MYKHGQRHKKKRNKRPVLVFVLLAIFSSGLFLATAKSLVSFPTVYGASSIEIMTPDVDPVKLAWPKYGQSAIGAKNYGILETTSSKKAQPTASVAKVMTAMAILEKYPLQIGEQGPMIPISQADEELFGEYLAQNGTSVRVKAGEEYSLYRALQYILIISSNNLADTAAVWAFGSMENYQNFANEYAKKLGMENSNFADGSGFSPKTVSTAPDLLKLADKAMQNPVFAEIVRTWEVKLPDGNKAQNSNVFLEFNGNRVIGIKSGDTDQAGGVYMFAGEHDVGDETLTIVGVVMGAKTLSKAQQDAMKLLESSKKGFSTQKIVSHGQKVGTYDVPWQGPVDVVSNQDIFAVVWEDTPVVATVNLESIKEVAGKSKNVGEITLDYGALDGYKTVSLAESIESPSTVWRLKRYL